MNSKKKHLENILSEICGEVQRAVKMAIEEEKQKNCGGQPFTELLLARKDKISVYINKEKTNHHEPHVHIKHSDKIDATMRIRDFSILAGTIDQTTKKHLIKTLKPKQPQLMEVWNALNEKDSSIEAHKIIDSLGLK